LIFTAPTSKKDAVFSAVEKMTEIPQTKPQFVKSILEDLIESVATHRARVGKVSFKNHNDHLPKNEQFQDLIVPENHVPQEIVGAPFAIFDVELVISSLETFGCCTICKSALHVHRTRSSGGPCVDLFVQCNNSHNFCIPGSRTIDNKKKEIPLRFMETALVVGMRTEQTQHFCNLFGMNECTKSTKEKASTKWNKHMSEFAQVFLSNFIYHL
jgi:hypothetical protein